MSRPKIAVIGTGGTITALGKTPLDLSEYIASGKMLEADELVAKFSIVETIAEIVPIRMKAVSSTAVAFGAYKNCRSGRDPADVRDLLA
jgi:L-asparaginase